MAKDPVEGSRAGVGCRSGAGRQAADRVHLWAVMRSLDFIPQPLGNRHKVSGQGLSELGTACGMHR